MYRHISRSQAQLQLVLFAVLALGAGIFLLTANVSAETTGALLPIPRSLTRPNLAFPQCAAGSCSITETTVADFNPGTFYLTGMTKNVQGGGDGDGEVRLLTFGISQSDWNSVNNGFPPALIGDAAAQKNGVIFVSGGKDFNTNKPVSTIYTSTIQSTHLLSAWQQSAVSLPISMTFHGMVIVNNTLVVIGGADSTGHVLKTVYTSTIGSNGTLSPFQTAAPLPVSDGRSDFGVTVVNGTIYVIGGLNDLGDATDTVFYATPDPSTGAITGWLTTTLTVPRQVAQLTSTSYNGKFYEIGGFDGASTFYPYVDFSQPSGSGDVTTPNYTSTVPLNNNLALASSLTFGGQIYVIGGEINSSTQATNTIYSAIISPTGYLNDTAGWSLSPVLSTGRVRSPSIMSDDGWIYVIGGLSGGGGASLSPLSSYDYGPTSGSNATNYAPSGTYTSPVIDLTGNYTVTNIAWNTTITNGIGMSLTLQYFCGSSPSTLTTCSAPPTGGSYGMLQTSNISLSQPARYWKYVVNFVRGSTVSQSPILNWVRFDYSIPFYPDFAINGLSAPPGFSSPVTQTQIITYWVSNKTALSAPVRKAPSATNSPKALTKSTGGVLVRPPPTQVGSSPTKLNAPQSSPPSYLFYIYFYADPFPVPTAPMSVTNALSCIDANALHPGGPFLPFIYYNLELYKTPSVFYAQCTVPANAHNFWAQIDACPVSDPYCTPNGYVTELDETGGSPSYADNIVGPVPVGTSIGGGGGGGLGPFLPFIKRSP